MRWPSSTMPAKLKSASTETGMSPSALLVAARYDEVIDQFKKLPPNHPQKNEWEEAAASSLVSQSSSLQLQADKVRHCKSASHFRCESKDKEERRQSARRAGIRYSEAARISPKDAAILKEWGDFLLSLSRDQTREEAQLSLALAIEKYVSAGSIVPGVGAYNAACAAALRSDHEEARRWLETAARRSSLPRRDAVERDKDLDSFRKEDWFKEIVAKCR